MPTLEENITAWNKDYDWSKSGDEWSTSWGGVDAQWFGTLLPRLQRFLPAKKILEIAPGMGRWTEFLIPFANQLVGVDISDRCTEVCKQRFSDFPQCEFHTNDGTSLEMIENESLDFVFSFDSLVHAEFDVMEGYLQELTSKLAPDGFAFLHHSNLGQYAGYHQLITRSYKLKRVFESLPFVFTDFHWRAKSVSAEKIRTAVDKLGLHTHSQELINWGTKSRRFLIDCISIISKRKTTEPQMYLNPDFVWCKNYWRKTFKVYDQSKNDNADR